MNIWEIHPALVHFPIALLLSGVTLDLVGWWRRKEAWIRGATWLLIAGAATGILAANFGLLAFYTVPAHTDEAHRLMYWHMGTAATSLVLFIWVACLRWLGRSSSPSLTARIVGLTAAVILTVAGSLGGNIVYRGGAGVDPRLLVAAVRGSHGPHGHGAMGEAQPENLKEMDHSEKGVTPDTHTEDMKGMKHSEEGETSRQPGQKPEMKGMKHGRMESKPETAIAGDQSPGQMGHEHKTGQKDTNKAKADEKRASSEPDAGHHHEATAKKPQVKGDDEPSEAAGPSAVAKMPDEHAHDPADTKGKEHQGHEVQSNGRQATAQKKSDIGQSQEKKKLPESAKELPKIPSRDARAAEVPTGYRVSAVATDLEYPTSIEFDEAGTMYIAEGGYIYGDDVAPARVLRIATDGSRKVVADQLAGPVTDLLWHEGRLFISQRGKISVLEPSGVRDLVTDLPSFGDHHNNQMTIGPDGKLYFGQGTATNSGVVGLDNFKLGWLTKYPRVHDVPAKDIRLRGEDRREGKVQVFETPDPLAMLAEMGEMKAEEGEKDDMAGMDHEAQGKQEKQAGENSAKDIPAKGHESMDPQSKQKKQSSRGSDLDPDMQEKEPTSQSKGMKGMHGMDHGSAGKQSPAKEQMKGMKPVEKGKDAEMSMDHGKNGMKANKKDKRMQGMDHDMKGMKGMDHDMNSMKGMDEMPGMNQGPARTSAFQPFGKTAPSDGTVRGEVKANGTILRMDTDGSNLEVYAWGLRNPFGLMWGPDEKLYASDNGYDERGSRPVAHAPDALWTIQQNEWYGFPDYAAGIPLTESRFQPERGPAIEFLMHDHPPIAKPLATLKAHAGAAKMDFSRSARFGFAGQMFVALSGDMNPITGDHPDRSGFEVVRVDLKTGETKTFFKAKVSAQGPKGMEFIATAGPRRPVDVLFSPDGLSLYVVDVGAMAIVSTAVGPVPRPFPQTGVVWRITRPE